jgi:hypothetical protein
MRSQQGVDDVPEQVVTMTSASTRDYQSSITFLLHVSYTPTVPQGYSYSHKPIPVEDLNHGMHLHPS